MNQLIRSVSKYLYWCNFVRYYRDIIILKINNRQTCLISFIIHLRIKYDILNMYYSGLVTDFRLEPFSILIFLEIIYRINLKNHNFNNCNTNID